MSCRGPVAWFYMHATQTEYSYSEYMRCTRNGSRGAQEIVLVVFTCMQLRPRTVLAVLTCCIEKSYIQAPSIASISAHAMGFIEIQVLERGHPDTALGLSRGTEKVR